MHTEGLDAWSQKNPLVKNPLSNPNASLAIPGDNVTQKYQICKSGSLPARGSSGGLSKGMLLKKGAEHGEKRKGNNELSIT